MCGIVGIIARGGSLDRMRAETSAAVASLKHRGPDDSGTWFGNTGNSLIALGHTRLSIIDLTAAGHQPLVSDNGRQVLVFNGEIYNFAEIRSQLELLGHVFAGTGDTEVVLHALQEWGTNAVNRFIGMFAIAFWDESTRTLTLMRDRVGVKPLYFGWHSGTLCFASELKALHAFTHWHRRINLQALGEYFQYGYIADDRTIFEGVHKLRPGHRLTLKLEGEPIIERFWSLETLAAAPLIGVDRDLEAELESLLVDAAKLRMISDVPVGVYLSGGIDSSLVTALLARHHGQAIRTFTIGFRDISFDESKLAASVAQHCGTLHTEYILDVNEALSIAREWGRLFDEPFGDSSGIPTLLVSRLASRDVKVVLSADGGDELFGGYNSYESVLARRNRLEKMPAWFRHSASRAISALANPLVRSVARTVPLAARGVRRLDRWGTIFANPELGSLFDLDLSIWLPESIQDLVGNYHPPRTLADSYPGDAVNRLCMWDFHHYLPEDILTKVDRTTMAVSIEGREPLLDHRLAEFAFRLPLHLRRGELGPKHILKSILYRHVPRDLVDRPKKGFSVPLDSWLRGSLHELVTDYLSESRIRSAGLLNWPVVLELVKAFYSGDNSLASRLWFMLAFEMWREHWT